MMYISYPQQFYGSKRAIGGFFLTPSAKCMIVHKFWRKHRPLLGVAPFIKNQEAYAFTTYSKNPLYTSSPLIKSSGSHTNSMIKIQVTICIEKKSYIRI